MDRRHILLALFVISVAIVGVGCKPDPNEIDHFVVALQKDNPAECWVYPNEIEVKPGIKWIIVSNYSPNDPVNTVKVEIKDSFAKINRPVLPVELAPGKSMMFELKSGLPSGSVYPFKITGGMGACLTGLPNPKIVIP